MTAKRRPILLISTWNKHYYGEALHSQDSKTVQSSLPSPCGYSRNRQASVYVVAPVFQLRDMVVTSLYEGERFE